MTASPWRLESALDDLWVAWMAWRGDWRLTVWRAAYGWHWEVRPPLHGVPHQDTTGSIDVDDRELAQRTAERVAAALMVRRDLARSPWQEMTYEDDPHHHHRG